MDKVERAQRVGQRLDAALASTQDSTTSRVGSILAEGDKTHGADRARAARKLSGVGITVGVLSDGVDSLTASMASGDLPADVRVLKPGYGDEGTAMLEIVHDVAPRAKLAFATANNTPEEFAQH
ncbi:hypothetical protein I6F37_39210, partial [Bradyrhizobium sp. NBAIM08]